LQSTDKQDWIPKNPDYDPNKPMQVGGQAVIEGVMMRAPNAVATAIRRANGQIVVRKEPFRSVTQKYRWLDVPIVRGAVGLIEMMILGIQTLNYSAEVAMLDAEKTRSKRTNGTNGDGSGKRPKSRSSFAIVGTLIIALALGVGIFIVVPLLLTTRLFAIERTAIAFNLVAGGIRLVILLLYLAGISFMKDIGRLFRYHGAEHKSVFAFELKAELVPEAVKAYSRFHPRCGTSFLLIVMFVAILAFGLLDALLIAIFGGITLPLRLLTHIPFIPVVGGAAYEVIKTSAKHSTTLWGRILIAPGLWLQKITTKEPDNAQIEVALVALRCALGLEDPERYSLVIEEETTAATSPARAS
jgi:uncharacterized protein YqhQ